MFQIYEFDRVLVLLGNTFTIERGRREAGLANGEFRNKCRPFSRLRNSPDFALMPFRDFSANSEPDSCAFGLRIRVDTDKGVENPLGFVWRKTDAIILADEATAVRADFFHVNLNMGRQIRFLVF